MQDFNYTPPPPRPKPAPLPMLQLPREMVSARMKGIEQNILVQWILDGIRWDSASRQRIRQALHDYCIGHSPKNGMTIFWQIDNQGRVRTGKMMLYRTDGHRDRREGVYNFDWIHSALYRSPQHPQYDEDKLEMQQTLFGMHLLDRYRHKGIEQVVNIVESEKTALLMAIAYGNNAKQVWMACGGKENLSTERLKPLIDQRRRIILYPDRDGIEKWQQKATQIDHDRVEIDTRAVTDWWCEEDGPKADIADVVLRIINTRRPMTNIDEVVEQMPQAKELINKLDLQIADEQ